MMNLESPVAEERALATIRCIDAIDPIPNADLIVCLTIDGWKLVSGIENFEVGDLCVYFEIDSFLPVRPEFEFLRDRCFKSTKNIGDGFRLKTIKLRGQISQGLALPLKEFPELEGLPLGANVTELLGIKKYEKISQEDRARLGGNTKGNFPSFLRKTDQERVQNCLHGIKDWVFGSEPKILSPEVLARIPPEFHERAQSGFVVPDDEVENRDKFELTVKLDGSSMTIYHKDCSYGVCSRNLELKRNAENAFWEVALKTGVFHDLMEEGRNLALQGELMGPGVQGNREKLTELHMFVFDIFDIDAQRYFTPQERIEWFSNFKKTNRSNHIQHVPLLGTTTLSKETTVDELLKMADEVSSLNHTIAEGIVFRNFRENGPTFKVISNKFLLNEKD